MDYNILLEIGKILLLSHFIVKFEPIQWVLEIIKLKIKNDNVFDHLVLNILTLLTSCMKCCSLWLGLILYGLWPALIASYIAHIYSWKIDPIIEKITLPTYGEKDN
jgi:hypothetical protein